MKVRDDVTIFRSLLSLIAQNDARGLEDSRHGCTALHLVSLGPPHAKRCPSITADDRGPFPIAKVQTWAEVSHGAVPDLACHDSDNNLVAFIESKFWASLTRHQPVTYWQALPDDSTGTVLVFLAPDYRVDDGSLWDELVERLQDAGHELGPASTDAGLRTASSKAGQRRLMLTSWESLLDGTCSEDQSGRRCPGMLRNRRATKGLAIDAIERDNPERDENLKLLIADAVKRVEQLDWANTEGLTAGHGLRLLREVSSSRGGVQAGLVIHYEAVKQMPDKPLWLWFWPERDAQVNEEVVRTRLGAIGRTGTWLASREGLCANRRCLMALTERQLLKPWLPS